jgi:hypothetical protein
MDYALGAGASEWSGAVPHTLPGRCSESAGEDDPCCWRANSLPVTGRRAPGDAWGVRHDPAGALACRDPPVVSNDQRAVRWPMAHGMIRSLTDRLSIGSPAGLLPRHPTSRLRGCRSAALLKALRLDRPSEVFRHVTALVRMVTDCVEFAAWAIRVTTMRMTAA